MPLKPNKEGRKVQKSRYKAFKEIVKARSQRKLRKQLKEGSKLSGERLEALINEERESLKLAPKLIDMTEKNEKWL